MSGAPVEKVEPQPGTVLCGKYRVERALGRGGMGTVVLATHLKLELPVAIKLLPGGGPSDYASARFLREARAMARLSSEHVVRVVDLDQLPDGSPVLVMEFLEGVDLERRLAQGPVELGRAIDWALQACTALAEAHARGIVHRDVKPANLFVVQRLDGREQVKLLDFGISKLSGDDVKLTRTATGLGSPLFMSPEQLLTPRDVDARTDVWSLGVTLFRLLSGSSPYSAEDASTLAAQIAARPPTELSAIAPALPEGLAAVVMRCLEKDAAKRWPDVVALAEALAPFSPPDAVGSLSAVRRAAQASPPASTPTPVSTIGPRTLSHDVPRVVAPVAVIQSAKPPTPVVAPERTGARKPARPALLALAAVTLLGLLAVVWRTTSAPSAVVVQPPAVVDPPLAAAPAAEPLPPAAIEPPPSAPPPSVERLRPTKKPGRPTDAPKDPADLEIKE